MQLSFNQPAKPNKIMNQGSNHQWSLTSSEEKNRHFVSNKGRIDTCHKAVLREKK